MINKLTENIVVAGVSFKTTELLTRSRFAFNADACRDAYRATKDLPFFILSTCNRTEIYSWSSDIKPVLAILQRQAMCTEDELTKVVYVKRGNAAVDHFFRVSAGLESQIVGDYEIISQIKTAFRSAKELNSTNGLLEKMFNFALQASKEVKNETSFSDGTLSVTYAVIKQLMTHRNEQEIKTITVVGAGETGALMIKYIREHLPTVSIRLVNRDEDKLHSIGSKYDVMQFPLAAMSQSLIGAEVLIVTTNAASPIVERDHIHPSVKLIFDLSVPRNVSPDVYRMNAVSVHDVDAISESIQNNMNARLSEIPAVEKIISHYSQQFGDWMQRRETYIV